MNRELLNPQSVIVQGITGTHGAFHTAAMLAAGTKIIAGTSPSKAGEMIHGVPVYAKITDIQESHNIDCSIIFVPPQFAKSALLEAIAARVPLVICITEGIPVHDMLEVYHRAKAANVRIIGPNCPGVLLPSVAKLGIIPASIGNPGKVALVSRSGTLTYEAAAALSQRGLGQKYIVGIGGDRIQGTTFVDILEIFYADPDVSSIILIGEIGGRSELEAADYIQAHQTKPTYAYVAGHQAPLGVQLGHAGAILGSAQETAAAKTSYLQAAGVTVANNLPELIASVR